jgi:chromosomal replication initiation ATPase DnaA
VRSSAAFQAPTEAVLIEFVGAAGVGKTFLSHAVAAELAKRGIPAKLFRSIPVPSSRIRKAQAWLRAAWTVRLSRPSTLSAFRAQTMHIARHQLRWEDARAQRQVFLCDEGFFHRLRAFHRNSPGMNMTEIADRLARRIAVGDIVVVVQASVDTIRARRMARNKKGDKVDVDSVVADVRLMDESLATALHVKGSSRPELRVLFVDAETDEHVIVDRIASAAAEAYLRQRPRAARDGRLEAGKVSP